MPLLHQNKVELFLEGAQVVPGEYQGGVHFLHFNAVHARADPGVMVRINGLAELTSGGQHHIPRPPSLLGFCLQTLLHRAEAAPETTGALLCRA